MAVAWTNWERRRKQYSTNTTQYEHNTVHVVVDWTKSFYFKTIVPYDFYRKTVCCLSLVVGGIHPTNHQHRYLSIKISFRMFSQNNCQKDCIERTSHFFSYYKLCILPCLSSFETKEKTVFWKRLTNCLLSHTKYSKSKLL